MVYLRVWAKLTVDAIATTITPSEAKKVRRSRRRRRFARVNVFGGGT
jgi:hypothetical protein